MSNKVRSILALLVAMLVLMTSAQVMAQGSSGTTRLNEREFTGTVEAFDTTTITVDGHVINIVRAEIKDTIAIGVMVKVHYTVARSGMWFAREVELALVDAIGGDVNDDGVGHDVNDDQGQGMSDDGAGHDVGDDHGQDTSGSHSEDQHQGGQQDDGGHHGGRGSN